jgi:hypothetical protein
VNSGGTGGCLSSVQAAVDAVAPSGSIDVASGTFAESVIIPVGARMEIRGAGAELTIIDGTDGNPVIRVPFSRLAISDITLSGGSEGLSVEASGGTRSRASISRSVITANTGDGVSLGGGLKMTDCTVTNNGGSGIQAIHTSARLRMDRTTISGNLEGIRCTLGRCRVQDSTVSGNSGAGLVTTLSFAGPEIVVNATTFAGNGVGFSLEAGRARVRSSIVADSTPGPDVDAVSRIESRGYNIFETVNPAASISGNTATDLTAMDPMLGPLQDNGGPTATHALLAGSAALESTPRDCGGTDQRGIARRPAPCDRGAFEAP